MRTVIGILTLLAAACTPPATHHAESTPPGPEKVHHHRFEDAQQWAKRFEDPKRDEWQKPDDVIAALKLPADAKVADIGSATGYFSVRLARAVPQGRVWGADIEPDMVRYLNARARNEKLDNLFSVLAEPSDPLLPEPVDLVLIVDTYHHIGGRNAYFKQLTRYLRPGARLVIIDFTPESPLGPPVEARITADEVTAELRAAGYKKTATHDILPHQYFVVYRPAE